MKERALRLSLFALSLGSVCIPGTVFAQSDTTEPAQHVSGTMLAQNQQREFVVYFPLGESALDETAQATIATAAQEFQRTGSTAISVRGHTDTSGNADFNQALSQRREEAVTDELVRQGVPADAISAVALGETELAVPTGDGVVEAENRRVEISVQAPPPPPEPVPEPAPVPAPAPQVVAPEPEEPERGLVSIGPFYGYNLGDETGSSHLAGLNLSVDYAVLPFLALGAEQAGFYHFGSENDGFGGRTAASANFLLGTEEVAGHVGGNIGYLYGSGLEDDFFAGPEIGVTAGGFHAKVAYDIPFSEDIAEGIIAGTVGYGIRF